MATLGTFCFDGEDFSQASGLYTDNTLSTPAADGFYAQGLIVRQQLSGVLLNAQNCGACLVECGSGVSENINAQNGLFDANINVANSTGAVILRFYMGSGLPDGVIAQFNSVNYNRLTAKNNHNGVILLNGASVQVDYAGINNQGTNLPTYVGNQFSALLSNSPYSSAASCPTASGSPANFSLISGTYVDQGTTTAVTVTSDSIGFSSDSSSITSPVFSMVVPKTVATPTVLNLKIFAPICNTAFVWEIDCPISLSSFSASGSANDFSCSAATTTYYFLQNATGTTAPFTVDTNTIPEIGNFVFSDANGTSYLNDSSVIKYYIIANTTYIGVRNGVVVSLAPCGFTAYSMSQSYGSPALACASTDTPNTVYFLNNDISDSVSVFTDAALNNVFVGDSGFYKLYRSVSPTVENTLQINNLGSLMDPPGICT
tara:strand:+ start:1487 stop:2776 length:1290 start_codon:yes stop_codon:yes gene_type:complete